MFFVVLKGTVPLGVHSCPQQGLCPVISMHFLSSHSREYLFSRTCMLPALAWHILLLGRSDVVRPHVHKEGRNWLVAQDLIGACHMHTCVHKKIPRHMKLRVHTRNTANSRVKSAFSGSLERQRDVSLVHCQDHNGWRLPCRIHVYSGDSDHMLYEHITVLTSAVPYHQVHFSRRFLQYEKCTFPEFGYKQKSNHLTPQTRYFCLLWINEAKAAKNITYIWVSV
jgi:hypothetical protein